MRGKIAFEEHFALPETRDQALGFVGESSEWSDFERRLLDLGAERLDTMEAAGIEFSLLSLNAAGAQGIVDPDEAHAVARRSNDVMAQAMADHPARYGALASVALHDAERAAEELTRCVETLGFHGCMVNGFQEVPSPEEVRYLDHPDLREFWATVERLGAPIYLHPRSQIPSRAQAYEGHPWLMSGPWGFAVETSIHALRICGSGCLEEFPNAKVCLGHLGENIPFGLARLEERMRFSPRGYLGARPLGDYFRSKFHITVSGFFDDIALRCTVDVMGIEKVHFSTDYPFASMNDAADWFDSTPVLSSDDRAKVGRLNAIELFGLP